MVLSVLLHAVAALESSILEEGVDTMDTTSVCILSPVVPVGNAGDIRGTATVLHAMCTADAGSTGGMLH